MALALTETEVPKGSRYSGEISIDDSNSFGATGLSLCSISVYYSRRGQQKAICKTEFDLMGRT